MKLTNAQLNALQDAGIISDNCVTCADIAPCDWIKAIEWLESKGLLQSTKSTP